MLTAIKKYKLYFLKKHPVLGRDLILTAIFIIINKIYYLVI